jgi:hypothetical protein
MLSEGYAPEEVDKALATVATPEPVTPDHVPGETESVARGAKQGITAGWGDEGSAAIAATAPFLDPEAAKGETWGARYEAAKKFYRGLDTTAKKENPVGFVAGNVVGSLLPTSKIIGAAKGGQLLARSAAAGALSGAGESNEGTLGGVLGDALGGGALGLLAALPIAALDKLPALKSWLAKQAQIEAFKQAAAGNAKSVGGKLAREAGQGRAQQVGQYILDKGLLGKGDMPADILANARLLKSQAGADVGKAIGQSGATVHLPDLIDSLETKVLANARSGGSLYSGVANKVAGVVDDLKTIQAKLGDDVPAALIHELKVKHAGAIDWASDKPLAEALQQVVGTEAGSVFKAVKGAGAGEALRSANQGFGLAADLEKTAKKGAESVMNRQIGVSELGTGGAGAVVGALAGGAPGAAIGSMGSALAANFWRKHGSGIAARAMSSAENIIPTLQASPRMTPYLDLFRRTAAAAGPAGMAALHFELWDKDQTYRQGMQDAEKAGGQ